MGSTSSTRWPQHASKVSRSALLVSEMYVQNRGDLFAHQIASIRNLAVGQEEEEIAGAVAMFDRPAVGYRAMAERDRIEEQRFHILLDN